MSAPTVEIGTKLPELAFYGDPTFIISTAIATRDYQDVHHDRDKAQAKGSKDIFVNISAVQKAGLSTLNEGQTVEYEEVANRGKTSAENLKV